MDINLRLDLLCEQIHQQVKSMAPRAIAAANMAFSPGVGIAQLAISTTEDVIIFFICYRLYAFTQLHDVKYNKCYILERQIHQ